VIRAQEESVKLSGDALSILTKMSENVSLRYAMQLISNADIIRQRRKGEEVSTDDVKKVFNLFVDVERVKKVLKSA
jgi:RuvB-like protein 2